MPEHELVARSPVATGGPVAVVAGWAVGSHRREAALTLTDCTPLAKVLVRAAPEGAASQWLGAPFGRAVFTDEGVLVTGSAPGEWTLFAAPGEAKALVAEIEGRATDDDFVSVLDITHGRALMRIAGAEAPALLAKLCAVDLGDAVTPDGAVFRSSVAKVVTDVVRQDIEGAPSYLLHCERSYGMYLFGALLDAGVEHGIEVDGFSSSSMRGVL